METWEFLVGRDSDPITWWQMSTRGVLLFLWGLVLVRIGGKRIFGKNSAFDIVLAVVIGSNLSRAITGNADFFPTVVTCTVLVLLHVALSRLSWRSKTIGHAIKGGERRLVADGEINWEAMRRSAITERDLKEALRLKGYEDLRQVQSAFIERNGEISVIGKRG